MIGNFFLLDKVLRFRQKSHLASHINNSTINLILHTIVCDTRQKAPVRMIHVLHIPKNTRKVTTEKPIETEMNIQTSQWQNTS